MSKATFEKINDLNENQILRVKTGHCPKGTTNTPNWHEAVEILFCVCGSGTVLLDDKKYLFEPENIIVVNSQVIHSVTAAQDLNFIFVQLDRTFCLNQLIDIQQIRFDERIEKDEKLIEIFNNINNANNDESFLGKAKKSRT
ncbi:MAG: AraC family ligand binding domain-containing protein, partial [Clostridia bacterium]|nr:AraC family ligand binding domain-containing protein [Clostridia bacterium]